jgi:mono/diheme cytochrome c family protein
MNHSATEQELCSTISWPSKKSWRHGLSIGAIFAVVLVLAACTSASMNDLRPSGSTSSSAAGPTPGTELAGSWCAALAVFRDNCQGCHAAQPLYGAPMSLLTIDNLRARSVTTPSQYVYELVAQRIHDDQKPMPPPSTNDRLSPSEVAAVDAWITSGATGGSDPSCSSASTTTSAAGPSTGGGAPGSITGGGASAGSGAGGTGGGGASGAGGSGVGGSSGTMPPTTGWPADCEKRYTFLAHGQSQPNDATKFNVSTAPVNQFYECFFFKAPWTTDAIQALAFRPIIDDKRVVHHWILYGSDAANGTDGQVGGFGCSTGSMLAGWAPGGMGSDLPPDVGLQMPKGAGATLALEIHYNNVANYKDALDASGVELCTTKTFRPNTAAVHWLGSNSILMLPHQTVDVVSTCDPTSTQPVHIFSDSPHMHQLGVHAKLILNRKNGTHETLHDQPFSFSDQRIYPLDVIVNDGDTLTTTCSYNNTTNGIVSFGPNTENEMCYNFVTAYPAGGLSGPAGSNHCLGP